MSAPTNPTAKISLRQKFRQSLSSRLSSSQTSPASQSPASVQNVTSVPSVSATTSTNLVPQPQQQSLLSQTVGQTLLDRALQCIPPHERVTLQDQFVKQQQDVHLAVELGIKAAEDRRQSCLQKRWIITIAGRQVVLKEVADKVIVWLDRFKTVGDVAANADPIHIGLPWAGIRLLLEAATAERDQMASLLIGCDTVLYTASRLKAYTEFMQTLPSTLTRSNLEEAIVNLYAHILHFIARAIELYQTSTLRLTLSAFGKIDDIVQFEKKGNELAMKVEFDANACGRDFELRSLQQVLAELRQIHQLQASLNHLHLKIDLGKIPYAKGAIFNSNDSIHTACHPLTRVDLLAKIQHWTQDPHSKLIFWLHGAAGAGKSTISWTMAQWLENQGGIGVVDLGASFFFKRGEGDRGSAARFFPTIVRQLVLKLPGLDVLVAKVIEEDPFIFDKALGEQFRKLLYEPLQDASVYFVTRHSIVVVDALDECENDNDIETVLQLWSQLFSITGICLRLLLTSRPDPPVRLRFKQISSDLFDNIVLQDAVPQTIMRQDLRLYLQDNFKNIREQTHVRNPSEPMLNNDWPSDTIIETLVEMAVPLFIVAATVCRFVGDPEFDPLERLDEILKYGGRLGQMAQMEMTYLPVLSHLTANSRSASERQSLCEEFRAVVGSIICLAEPLSVHDLAALLNKTAASITRRLNPLHSVLQVPVKAHSLVRTLHLSFAEFLLSESLQNQPYGVDSQQTHSALAQNCLQLLSGQNGLEENMCNLNHPGCLRQDIDKNVISQRFSTAFQYACRYWVHHVQNSREPIMDNGPVHNFLRKHYLHWLEALSIINRLAEVVELLNTLQSVVSATTSILLLAFLEDAQRFILAHRHMISHAPLQLYASGIIFTPSNSLVRKTCGVTPEWIQRHPTALDSWSLERQILEGHDAAVNAVAFSSSSTSLLASASDDHTVRLWNVITGEEVQKLIGHRDRVKDVAFSPDGLLLASASDDCCVRLWNMKTGMTVETLGAYDTSVFAVTFSPDGQLLALRLGWGKYSVLLWDVNTGQEVQILQGHNVKITAVAFSDGGKLLASASADGTVRMLDIKTHQEVRRIHKHVAHVGSMLFSPDGSQLITADTSANVQMWNVKTGEEVKMLFELPKALRAVAFSPDGSLLAFRSNDYTVRLWDVQTGREMQKLKGHCDRITDIAFSDDGLLLASASRDATVRLWYVNTDREERKPDEHGSRIRHLRVSPDKSLLASVPTVGPISIWDVDTGRKVVEMGRDTFKRVSFDAISFSTDGHFLAAASYSGKIMLYNVKTGHEVRELGKVGREIGVVCDIAFSPDDVLLASASPDCLLLWNIQESVVMQKLEARSAGYRSLAFSSDGMLVANGGLDGLVLWEVKTGREFQFLTIPDRGRITTVAFSPDCSLIASAFSNKTVRIWDVKTGLELLRPDRLPSLWTTATEAHPPQYIQDLRFTIGNTILVTDQGSLNIEHLPVSVTDMYAKFQEPGFFGVRNEWILYGGSKILWLPREYRGIAIVDGGIIAIGAQSGRVSIFHLVDPKTITTPRLAITS